MLNDSQPDRFSLPSESGGRLSNPHIAKYLRLQWYLEDQIRNGQLALGGKLPSHCELMKLYACSCSTITKALQALVAGGLITRKRKVGTFITAVPPTHSSQEKYNPSATTLGMFHRGMPKDFHPYFSALMEGLFFSANERGYTIKFILSGSEGLQIDDQFTWRHGICGAIVSATRPSDLEAACQRRIPLVFLYDLFPTIPVERVLSDPRQGALLAFRHFRALGHSSTAAINLRTGISFDDISAEIYDCLPHEAPVVVISADSIGRDEARRVIAEWQNRKPRPTAMYVTDDILLRYLWRELQEAGVRVPEDLAVIGWGSPRSAGFLEAPITMVETDPALSARRAVERVLAQIAGKGEPGRVDRIPPVLVVRASCGGKGNRGGSWKPGADGEHGDTIESSADGFTNYRRAHAQAGDTAS